MHGLNEGQQAWRFWPIWLIYNTIWDNAISKPAWKFGEPKWNPYWAIVLTSSSGTNHVLNKHEASNIGFIMVHGLNEGQQAWRFWPMWLIYNTIWDNAISKPSWKFGEPKWNPYWVIMLTSSSGTNCVLNEHEYVDKYGSFAIPSEIVPW